MNPLDQLRDEIANLHLLADRLVSRNPSEPPNSLIDVRGLVTMLTETCARTGWTYHDVDSIVRAHVEGRTPSHDLVVAADAMRALFPKAAHDCLLRECSIVDAYDTVRARHASGAQPDSACDEIGWLVEITGPRYWTGTPGCGNWTADSRAAMRFARRQDAEAACRHLAPSGAIPVEHAWVSHRPAGAQPSGAPAPYRIDKDTRTSAGERHATWRVEVAHGQAWLVVDASGESGEQSFWINDHDDEPGHAEFHARMLRIAISRIVGAPALASAQGEVCECGHGRAMHFDEDGDHNGACLYQMNDKPFCRCDMFRAKDKERA